MALRGIDGGKGAGARKAKVGLSLHPDDYEDKIPASEFITPAADSKGHCSKLETYVPPGMAHEIDIHVAGKGFPWKTRAEVVRWMVYRGLEALAKLTSDKEISNVRAQTAAIVAAARMQVEMLDFEGTVLQISRTLRRLEKDGDVQQARKLRREVKEHIDAMDDPDWQKKYRKALIQEEIV